MDFSTSVEDLRKFDYHMKLAYTEAKKIIENQGTKISDLNIKYQRAIAERDAIESKCKSIYQDRIAALEKQLADHQHKEEEIMLESLSEAWKIIDQQNSDIKSLKERIR